MGGTGAMAPPPAADEVWEPGAPSLRAMAPGAVVGGLVPFGVYQVVHPLLGGQVPALLVAGAVPAVWVLALAVVQRRIEPIGMIVLAGLACAVVVAAAGGGPVAVKAKDSVFAGAGAVACFGSLAARRPVMFHLGKALSAGSDPDRRAAFDALWELPTGPRTFRVVTVGWGVAFAVDAVVLLACDLSLPTRLFLVVDPAVGAVVIASAFAATVWYTGRARRRGEVVLAETGLRFPSVPRSRPR
jgi:hypothetical protein